MILTVFAAMALVQLKATDPVEAIKPFVRGSTVAGIRDGNIVRISVKHQERIFIGGGGQSAVTQSSPPAPEPPPITFTEQLVAISEAAGEPSESQLAWLPPQENFEVITADLGSGQGYRWFGHATFDVLRSVGQGLKLTGGESLTSLAVRSLNLYSYRNSSAAREYLLDQKDAAVNQLKGAASSTPAGVELLAQIRTPKAVAALIDLHTNPDLKDAVELAMASGEPVEDARPIYEGGLSNSDAAPYCARMAAHFGWTDLQPAIQKAYDSTKSPFTALELLDTLHRFKTGNSLPSFEKVHDYFSKWTPEDDRSVATAPDRMYGPLCVAKMISVVSKAGTPFAHQSIRLANLIDASGRGPDLKRVLAKFDLTARMEAIRKEASNVKG